MDYASAAIVLSYVAVPFDRVTYADCEDIAVLLVMLVTTLVPLLIMVSVMADLAAAIFYGVTREPLSDTDVINWTSARNRVLTVLIPVMMLAMLNVVALLAPISSKPSRSW